MATDDNVEFLVENTGENERTVHNTGSKIYLRRTDPYGFWYISFERGSPPEHLQGAYTTLDHVTAVVRNYVEENRIKAEASDRERVRTAKRNYKESSKEPVVEQPSD